MDTIRSRKIISLLKNDSEFRSATNHQIRADYGALVENYPDLVEKVAQLSFYNPEHVLFFRGQTTEYPNSRGNSSIKPSIFRPVIGTRPPDSFELARRYEMLARADQILADEFSRSRFLGRQRIVRHRLLRWAILQHYELCGTPLVDVTHSLRVAASFATNDAADTDPVVYVLAVPSISGSISASSEQGIQTIRLSSICPPDARRPYFQEGYLLAEYPDLASIHEKEKYRPHEIDFGRRVIAKFRLPRIDFWSRDYTAIPNEALYPNERDPLVNFSEKIRSQLMS
jgi:FRG domain